MAASRAPKQWALGKVETVTTFNAWKDNLLYILSLEAKFATFLANAATWSKYSSSDPNRGFTDDPGADDNPPTGLKKEEKVKNLNLFLGQIANYATIISRNQIVRNSTSLQDIWGKLREHYGLQTTGSKFIDLVNIRLSPGERYEDLYQRLLAFFEDNLLVSGDSITHHGAQVTVSEDLTPSLENVVVLLWLERIHISLPGLIKQKYGAELRNKTLSSLKSEISQSLDSMLTELKNSDDSRIMRFSSTASRSNRGKGGERNGSSSRTSRSTPFCCLCHAAQRRDTAHWLSRCTFLPESDRKRMQSNNRVRLVEVGDEVVDQDYDEDEVDTADNSCFIDPPAARRVTTRKSPHLKCFYAEFPICVCLDTGAESNLISHRFALVIGITIRVATQGAVLADAKSTLNIIGEVKDIVLTRGAHSLILDALVTEDDFGDVIGGEPFLEKNDIAVRPSKKQIIIKGRDIVPYDTSF